MSFEVYYISNVFRSEWYVIMRITMGEERLIVSGMTAEENPWGKYQFPLPYRVDDRIIVSVHVENDTLINTGTYSYYSI